MKRAYYSSSLTSFGASTADSVLGHLTRESEYSVEQTQRDAWLYQISHLQASLRDRVGWIYFEYAIPRMGKRVDVVLIIARSILVIEYKVGKDNYTLHDLDQVMDYALDLKNFHEPSHNEFVVPILVATHAPNVDHTLSLTPHNDKLFFPTRSNGTSLAKIVEDVVELVAGTGALNGSEWEQGSYRPTPTIIEAATALYNGHSVADISRSDAGGAELHRTTQVIGDLIHDAQTNLYKAVCFVTGVPGAGKTLVGLNVATKYFDKEKDLYSVFLSGNGPLVKILQEALARDKVQREKAYGRKIRKGQARSEVKMFIQNVHHYRDACLRDPKPPVDHVALFDEAQRAWDIAQTTKFMRTKKGFADFQQSEPEYLISCIDRHHDWGVVVCLVGGGQEINTGEAGIGEWILALKRRFLEWHIYISDRLQDSEYGAGQLLGELEDRQNVYYDSRLHLSVSMRSYRAEHVSRLVKQVLDIDIRGARDTLAEISDRYPIVLTRDLDIARSWLRHKARGSERYGIVVSSQANRLKPLAIDVRLKPDPIHWFLADKSDVRSSFYLEDVSTEFDVQGLELDWVCVTWDADFRHSPGNWTHHSFRGNRWQRINKRERQTYLKNAYRVLLTRARQGMIIVVPKGDPNDPTRDPSFYDPTYDYLRTLGFKELN